MVSMATSYETVKNGGIRTKILNGGIRTKILNGGIRTKMRDKISEKLRCVRMNLPISQLL